MAISQANRVRYLVSLAEELLAQATRVRDLIGNAHWLTDGHHKEYLLAELLRRHLPAGMIAARGFVIDPDNEAACSREQDVLIVDTMTEGPVFNQAGVVIAFPRAVRAAVSVKTVCKKETVVESVENLNSVRAMVMKHQPATAVWCGAFYFEPDSTVDNNPCKPLKYIADAVQASPLPTALALAPHPIPRGPDLHCTGREYAYKLNHAYSQAEGRVVPAKLLGYRCQGQATALFLGNLLDHLARVRGQNDCDFTSLAEGLDFECLDSCTLA